MKAIRVGAPIQQQSDNLFIPRLHGKFKRPKRDAITPGIDSRTSLDKLLVNIEVHFKITSRKAPPVKAFRCMLQTHKQ